jgi:AcrR family transcriptional regulator
MDSSLSSRPSRLSPADWTRAALARLGEDGIEAVRVEVLARDLKVSKGSFYWHFDDRADLLDHMLARWERDEIEWLETGQEEMSAANRWAMFVERFIDPGRIRTEVALQAWARRDERVARRLALLEGRRTALIAGVLREVGFRGSSAEFWSEIVLLVCLGWLDRATRDHEFQLASRGLGEFLSELVLAASGRPAIP